MKSSMFRMIGYYEIGTVLSSDEFPDLFAWFRNATTFWMFFAAH